MSASAKYQQQQEGLDGERPLKVCAEAGRKCVRNINQYPILSPEWIAVVDSLRQLTRLVQLEGRMPGNAKVPACLGRDAESEGTLWDQEANENAIRILVEEAKVNLCLRMMNDYKQWCYSPSVKENTINETKQAYNYSDAQIRQKLMQFEESLGLLLWRALVHVETLQLMDIPLLIEHCSLVLGQCVRDPDTAKDLQSQETVILYYYSSLMKHAEALNNQELLAKAREQRLVHLVVDHVLTNISGYPSDLQFTVAEGLAALADNEDFSCSWEDFFVGTEGEEQDRALKEKFLELDEKLAQVVIQENPDSKKQIRPLLDFFNVLKRSMR